MSANINLYLEQYSHETNGMPYSLHSTEIPKGCDLGLYLHWHHEVEFFYVESGTLEFYIEDDRVTLLAGEALFLPSHVLHKAMIPDLNGCRYHACVFSTELLTQALHYPQGPDFVNPFYFSGNRHYIAITPNVSWYCQAITPITSLMNYYKKTTESSGLLVLGTLINLWHILYTEYFSHVSLPDHPQGTLAQVENALNYIHHHYNDTITLAQLADASALSRGYFCKVFHDLYGLTPFEYLNRYRVKKACERLTDSTMPILDILYACGFNNASYFNRQFRKYTGMTPRNYRLHR